MDVSIILVSYNTKDMTRDCIKSIYQYTKDINFDIFVVDNNSYDGSSEMIEQEFPQVQLIKNPDNKGFGAANNIAIRESKAKYVFLLNTDTLLLNNTIKQFYNFMEKNKNVGACGCQLLDNDMKPQHSYAKFHSIWRILATIFYMHRLFPKTYKKWFVDSEYENDKVPYEVDYVTGADLFIRKTVLDECGMFDEDFFMYSEETEMQYRFKQAGYKSVIIPTINIIHYCGLPKKDIPIERYRMYLVSDILFYKKCYGSFSALCAKMLYLIKFLTTPRAKKRYYELIKLAFEIFIV